MKNIRYALLLIIVSFFFVGKTFATTCDQTFENNFVRYNYSYGFFDNISNIKSGAQDLYLNTWDIDYVNPEYLDKGIAYPNGKYWDWLQSIKDMNYKIVVGTNNIRMLETKAKDWRIAKHPTIRTTSLKSNFDFMISYKINYDYSNNYPDASDDLSHTECQYFSVTWCGDGVLDSSYETCDPNDSSEAGWGTGGCSIACNPLVVSSTCDNLTATKTSGKATFTSTFACNGTNASTYKILIKNNSGDVVKTINSQNGTYDFDEAGVFTSTCYVDDIITSSSCQETITVDDGDTTPGFDTVSCDSLTATPNSGEVPLDSSIVCSGMNVTKFKIDCGNGQTFTKIGTGTGSESFSKSCNYITPGTYSPRCTIDDTITNDDCEKTITVDSPPVEVCNQTFEDNYVRYQHSYNFYDIYNNNANQKVYLTNFFIDYINPEYLDQGGAFDWTPEIVSSGYAINAKSSMKFIKTGLPSWMIKKHPLVRTTSKESNFDFMIRYKVDYDYSNNYPNASDDISHTECQYFSVTWCGDGVLDSSYETCDYNDPSEAGFGTDGCDTYCEPKNVTPEATCDNLTVTPDTGSQGLEVTATCTGTNVTSYKILCGNGGVLNTSTGICTYPSAGDYEVSCIVNDTVTSNACKKTVTVNRAPTPPSIDIEKFDDNSSDLDGVFGNDTQKVTSGEKAVFKIRVTNYGTEALKDIVLTDVVEANCAGAVDMPFTIPSTFSNFVIGGDGNHSNAYLEPDEYFEYNCEKLNTINDYVNIVKVDAKGKDSEILVYAQDDTEVLVDNIVYGSCDSMTASPDTGYSPLNSTIVCTGTDVTTFKIDCDNGQTPILGVGSESGIESFSGVCNYSGVKTYTPKCYVDNTTNSSCKKMVTVKPDPVVPNISIDKIDANTSDKDGILGDDTQTVDSGDKAVFKIKVINNGAEDLKNIVLLDAISPSCAGSVLLPNTRPSSFENFVVGGAGNNGDNVLQPGEYFSYTCDNLNTQFDYTNIVTVNAKGYTTNISVTSTDDTRVMVDELVVSSCDNLSASPLNGINSLISTITCQGTKVDKFEIDCGNGQSIMTGVGLGIGVENFSGVCNYVGVGTYVPKCTINDTITNSSCEEVVSVTTSGGGPGPKCTSIFVDTQTSTSTGLTTDVTCVGNHKVKSFMLDCGNGDILYGNADSNYEYTGICEYEVTSNTLFKPKCSVSGITNKIDPNYSGWKTSLYCTSKVTVGGNSFCGDGVIQRPNSNGKYEDCERALDEYGNIGEFPDFCTATCEFIPDDDDDNPDTYPGVITIPNEGEIIFEPGGNIIIGTGMNPFEEIFQKPYVKNNSSYDLYFEKLCVVRKSGSTLVGNTKYCKDLTGILYPGQVIEFTSYPHYVGDISSLLDTESYGDNELVITIEDQGVTYTDAYFASKFNVRVSKPSVVTVGGGTSYVGDTTDISDVGEVADGYVDDIYENQNRNFVGASVSTGGISSYSNDVTDPIIVTDISDDLNTFDYNSGGTIGIPTTDITSDFTKFSSYNGIDNVYIIRNESFEINSDLFSSLTGPRTYIVENGDLIINSNIIYSENIAFIVKGGDIIVHRDVTNITGIFVIIKIGLDGGEIKGIGGHTSNILHIRGSIYGNTNNLISKRTYIKSNDSGQIDVGTIVSFGSSLFRRPAPLVGQFVEEYLEQQRIAQ